MLIPLSTRGPRQECSARKQDPPIGTPTCMDNDAQDGFRDAAAPTVFQVWRSGLSCTEHGRHTATEDTRHARETLSITGELDSPITA